jgi:DNA-binding NarL/FixJ family response regulator
MKVLIVEDNPKMRRMLSDFIGHKFVEIYECADGEEAFAFYQKHHPDWVLMDWQMPNKDGITATREIMAEFPAAKICLVTSFADDFLRSEALEAGAKGFVLKRNLSELNTVLV